MLQHVTPSPTRTAAVGRFLVALANSFSPNKVMSSSEDTRAEKGVRQTSSRRKRLHLLYIVNDVLFHVTFRNDGGDEAVRPNFTASIEPFLESLVASAASLARTPKQLTKIRSLLDLWGEKHYVSDRVLARLRTAADNGPHLAEKESQNKGLSSFQKTSVSAPAGTSKEVPFHLPAFHGDPSTPWYDLPAANWLAVLKPNSTRPMNPNDLKPLSMIPGPAPPSLVDSVQALLADVSRMFDEDTEKTTARLDSTDIDLDVSALGEHIEIDVLSGDIVGGETYYGWSRAFCKSMKERQKGQLAANGSDFGLPDADDDRRRAHGEDSRLSSPSPKPAFKKRRFSASSSPTRRDSRRSRSQSWSRSRSRSRSSSRGYELSRSCSRGGDAGDRSRLHTSGHARHRRQFPSRSPSRRSPHSNSYSRPSRSRTRSRSTSAPRSPQQSHSQAANSGRDHNVDRDHNHKRKSLSPHKESYEGRYPTRNTPPPPLHSQYHLPPPASQTQWQQFLADPRLLHHLKTQPGVSPPPQLPYLSHPGAGGFAFIPPPPFPPPGYLGPWPPPLPQMPHLMPNFAWAGIPPPLQNAPNTFKEDWTGNWTVPPPPMPRQQNQQQNQQTRQDPPRYPQTGPYHQHP